MNQYCVQGRYMPRRKSSAIIDQTDVAVKNGLELFVKTYWAASPEEALEAALKELDGGKWIGEPTVSETSEEMRMRAMGAPELPLDFGS